MVNGSSSDHIWTFGVGTAKLLAKVDKIRLASIYIERMDALHTYRDTCSLVIKVT